MIKIIWRVFYVVSFIMVLFLFYSLSLTVSSIDKVLDLSTTIIQRQDRIELMFMRVMYDSGAAYKIKVKYPHK